jgi:hypothetical protein
MMSHWMGKMYTAAGFQADGWPKTMERHSHVKGEKQTEWQKGEGAKKASDHGPGCGRA